MEIIHGKELELGNHNNEEHCSKFPKMEKRQLLLFESEEIIHGKELTWETIIMRNGVRGGCSSFIIMRYI
ncbi:hypothetical protein SUGI_0906650 [Cryptomeria japonica]|nr:hypothetical protein SUGI_0906650 [Cryptomeria japonica]